MSSPSTIDRITQAIGFSKKEEPQTSQHEYSSGGGGGFGGVDDSRDETSQSTSLVKSLEKTKDTAKERVDETKGFIKQKAEEMGIREPEKEPEPKTTMEKIQDGTQAAGDWVANKATDAKNAVLPKEEEKTPPSTKDQIVDAVEKTKERATVKIDETNDLIKQKAEEMGIREPEQEPEPKTAMEKIQDGTHAAGDWVANKATDAKNAVLPKEEEKTPPSTKDQLVDTVDKAKESATVKADETKEFIKHKAEEMGLREPEKEPEAKTTMEKIQDGTHAAGDWVANKATDAKDSVLPTGKDTENSTKDKEDDTTVDVSFMNGI